MRLKRTKQCAKCPWKTCTDPYDIPDGYDVAMHENLKKTIANPGDPYSTLSGDLHVMACHETDDAHCVGYLYNQLGVGNNIGLRFSIRKFENVSEIQVFGEQHERFEDTLPD